MAKFKFKKKIVSKSKCHTCALGEEAKHNCVLYGGFSSDVIDILVVLDTLDPLDIPVDGLTQVDKVPMVIILQQTLQQMYPDKTIKVISAVKCFRTKINMGKGHLTACATKHIEPILISKTIKSIIVCGNKAASYFGITGKKGKVALVNGRRIMFTHHITNYVLNNPTFSTHQEVLTHMGDLYAPISEDTTDLSHLDVKVLKTEKEMIEATEYILQHKVVAVDIEATGIPYQPSNVPLNVISTSFTVKDKEALVFPYFTLLPVWSKEENEHLMNVSLECHRRILTHPIKKIMHNGKYDVLTIELSMGIHTNNLIYDTLLLHYILDERPPHGLKDLTNQYLLDMRYYDDALDKYTSKHKEARPTSGGSYYFIPNDILLKYNGYDTIATYRLYKIFMTNIIKYPLKVKAYKTEVQPSIDAYLSIEKQGMYCDRKGLEAKSKEMSAIIADNTKAAIDYLFSKGISPNINFNATSDIAATLMALGDADKSEMKLVKGKTVRYTCDASVINTCISRGSVFAGYVSTIRTTSNAKRTYIDSWLSKMDKHDRLHPTFSLHGTDTGRTNCKNPNIQNVPPLWRKYFIAMPGYVRCEWDWSQLELRLAATISALYAADEIDNPLMLAAYNNKADLHKLLAGVGKHLVPLKQVENLVSLGKIDELISLIIPAFDALPKAVSKPYRQQGKKFNFSAIYKGTPNSIMIAINQDIDKLCKNILLGELSQEEKDTQVTELQAAKIHIICKQCGYKHERPIPRKNHKGDKVARTCKQCGHTKFIDEPAILHKAFFTLFPEIQIFHDKVCAEIKESGEATTIMGRTKHLPEVHSSDMKKVAHAFNAGVNQKIQSVGGSLKILSIIEAVNFVREQKLQSYVDNEVHDSINGMIKIEELFYMYDNICRIMNQWSDSLDFILVPLVTDMKIGFNWYDMEEVTNVKELEAWVETNIGTDYAFKGREGQNA